MRTLRNAFDADMSDIVENSCVFDADWYSSRYSDVKLSGLTPALHFCRFGQWLKRGVSEASETLDESSHLAQALRAHRRISYCIPIMNRGDDIRLTLRDNLSENVSLSELIEFVIIFYDHDVESHEWVRAEFPDELRSGYLRLIVSSELDSWHFGRAKNGFKKYIIGDVYSSLDGDNYVTLDETFQLLNTMSRFGDNFVFHHFSGSWGDGSSGRISVPCEIYRRIGYDDRFFPRQFDEIDLILAVLCKVIDITFVRYNTSKTVFSSIRVESFVKDRPRLPPRTHIVDNVRRRLPENPRGADYVDQNSEFKAMLSFNQALSFWKNSTKSNRSRFIPDMLSSRRSILTSMRHDRLIPAIVKPKSHHIDAPLDEQNSPAVFMCVKDDDHFLLALYAHYTRIGFRRFFIIDDGSKNPVHELLPFPNVYVFTPNVGTFLSAKAMWIEALIRFYLQPGDWVTTIDADEFLDLPFGMSNVRELTASAEQAGRTFIPALLLDMVPGDTGVDTPFQSADEFEKIFDNHAYVASPVSEMYRDHSSIRWGFGSWAELSWRFDLRYHAFNTFDSLRKIPVFRFGPHIHLNQGFHDLHFQKRGANIGSDIWSDIVLPLRHYKALKMYQDDMFKQTQRYVGTGGAEYHSRTSENITRIFGSGQIAAVNALSRVPRVLYSVERFREYIRGLTQIGARAS